MKKIIFMTTAFLLLGSTVTFTFAQKGDYKKALKQQNAAWKRMQQYGENDAEVLNLYTQTIDEYKRCVQMNDKSTGSAYHNLGRIYFTAPKSLRNYDEAIRCLQEAVKMYDDKKEKELKAMCYNDMGIAQYRTGDFSSAFSNFKKAAELSAQYSGGVADTYWLGLGVVEQDLPKAMELYGEAALAGRDLWANIYALNYQMKEYEKGNYDNKALTLYMDYFHAKSMDESKEVWMSKLTQSADLGFPPAQVDLWIYCRDSKEFSKGMLYLQKAAELDYVPAWFHLGYAYHAGLGVNIDYQMAEKWYENAAVEGHPTAQNNLGVLYQTNKIPSSKNPFKNAAMAYYWYNEAAEQGYAQAKYNRSQMKNASKEIFGRTATNRITKIISTSAETHRALDKSKMKTYTPSSETTGK